MRRISIYHSRSRDLMAGLLNTADLTQKLRVFWNLCAIFCFVLGQFCFWSNWWHYVDAFVINVSLPFPRVIAIQQTQAARCVGVCYLILLAIRCWILMIKRIRHIMLWSKHIICCSFVRFGIFWSVWNSVYIILTEPLLSIFLEYIPRTFVTISSANCQYESE